MSISVSSASIASLKVGGSGVSSVMLGGDVVYSSAGFSPASLSGLSLWLDAEKLAGTVEAIPPADGSLLSSWACRAHAGHSLVQPTATYQPEYLSVGIGSMPAVNFPDRNEFLYDSGLVIELPIQIAAVVQINVTGASQRYLFDGYNLSTERFFARYETTNSNSITVQTTSINEGDGQGTESISGAGLATGTSAHIVWISHAGQGQTSVVRKDGTQVASGSLGQERLNGITLGTYQPYAANQSLTALGLRGRVGEFVVSSGAQSADAMEKTEGYLAHRWGLASVLPASHPYKNEAP